MSGDVTTARSCPVCAAPSFTERMLADVHLYRCPGCDHCFTDPAQLSHTEQYGESYFEEKHRNWFAHPNVHLFQLISRTINASHPLGSVLDVGCGRGDLLLHLRRENPALELTGIDLSDSPPRSEYRFVRCDFQAWTSIERFDVVTTLAAIEHVANVRAFVEELVARCKPGGLIIIMTLNDRSVLYGTARLLSRVGYRRAVVQLYDRHHLNHFSAGSLRRLIVRSGLKIVQVHNHDAPMAAVDMAPINTPAGAAMRAGVWALFRLGRLVNRTYLQTVVARKPA
jgi:SAM-dependent methyltransferase